jgi:hypothetical protein
MAKGYGIRYTDSVESLNLNKGLFKSTTPSNRKSLKKQKISVTASARPPSYGRVSVRTISV